MFDDADPVLHRVREIALAFPGAAEKITHGHPAFYTKKVFAYFGGSRRVDGEWIQHERSIVVLLDEDERRAVSEDEHNSHYTVPISIFVICSFCIAMTAGTIWEIMEFCDDQIAGADSQHWDYSRLEDAKSIFYLHQAIPAGRYPIIDTMTDIICNLCGSIAGAIALAFFPYRQKGRQIDKDCEQYRLSHKNKKTGA